MRESPAESVQPAPQTRTYAAVADLPDLRAFVRAYAGALGLPELRGEMLALAVNELATNTLLYTDGGGTVRVWADDGQVICDVVDTGPVRSFGAMPAPDSLRGRGLPMVERIADQVAVTATADGTLVRIRMNL